MKPQVEIDQVLRTAQNSCTWFVSTNKKGNKYRWLNFSLLFQHDNSFTMSCKKFPNTVCFSHLNEFVTRFIVNRTSPYLHLSWNVVSAKEIAEV